MRAGSGVRTGLTDLEGLWGEGEGDRKGIVAGSMGREGTRGVWGPTWAESQGSTARDLRGYPPLPPRRGRDRMERGGFESRSLG